MTFAFLNLGSLSGPEPLFSDRDGDGYPDRVHMSLGLARAMDSGPVWAGMINLAARLSMESCSQGIAAPAISTTPKPGMLLIKNPRNSQGPAARLEKNGPDSWQLTGRDPLAMKQMLDSLALAEIIPGSPPAISFDLDRPGAEECRACLKDGQSLAIPIKEALPAAAAPETMAPPSSLDLTSLDLTSLADALLVPVGGNPRARRLALELVLPQTLSLHCGLALFGLVTAAASRATALTLPIAGPARTGTGALCLNILETSGPGALLCREKDTLNLKGKSGNSALLVKELTRLWFEADAPGGEKLEAWKKRLEQASAMAAGKNDSGRLLYRLARGNPLPPVDRPHWSKAAAACRRLNLPKPDKRPAQKIRIRQTTLPGEAKAVLAQARQIPRGSGQVFCRAFTGGDSNARLSVKERLERILTSRGYTPKIRVLRTHKPAVSWLLEEVDPQLPRNTHSLKISVRPFVKPDQMEPRARWIHELYPAPDVLCCRRGWPMDSVEMDIDENQAADYLVRAFDRDHKEVGRFSLSPMISALPYTLKGRDDQTAYPVAAGVELYQEGERQTACAVPTDREVFWRRFQERWLPEMKKEMAAMLADRLESGCLAFWEELRIEVAIDDDQEDLDFAQERIAPMEALHEDIYFGLLAFMEAFRKAHCPDSRIQLGRIVPVMRPARGKRPRAALKRVPLQHPLTRSQRPPLPRQIGFDQGMLFADFTIGEPDMPDRRGSSPSGVPALDREETRRLCTAAKAWGIRLAPHDGGIRYTARPAGKTAPATLPAAPVCPPNLETIPTGSQVRQWTDSLRGRPGMRVWRAGQTMMGRDIQAVEAVSGRMTAGRARLLKPTLLINARHHANEVSGTNAAMDLLASLASGQADPADQDKVNQGKSVSDLLRRINVVVVPLENGDGVATLEEMLPHAPDHKLHAARYNALGMEWYDQYFEADTPFSEARVKARLFDRWLPAYMIDLHGVPSHEWEQPFAGYLPPGFEEHWIPRSFVYAILPFYGRADHPGGQPAGALAQKMSKNLEKEREILELNHEIYTRYQRYAKAFAPERFDAGMAGALVVVPTCERISQTNFANRKWPLVQSEIVTEVLDEVARGQWLSHCALAHRTVIHTLTEHMAAEKPAGLIRRQTEGGISFSWEKEEEN